MNDFLDNLANHQYQKMCDRVEIKVCKNTKLIDIDYIIDLTEDEF